MTFKPHLAYRLYREVIDCMWVNEMESMLVILFAATFSYGDL